MQATESSREWPVQSAAGQPARCLQERVWLSGSEIPPAASHCVTLTLLLLYHSPVPYQSSEKAVLS